MSKKSGGEFHSVDEIIEQNLREGNISLILDGYDDIFSDFDPREYHERSLSDDFLSECKKVARDKGAKLELRLMVPHDKRNMRDELKIKKRLKSHFQKHAEEKRLEILNMKKEGATWFAIGTVLMIVSAFFYGKEDFIFRLLEVMMVPAGWFMFWEGLENIFIAPREKKPDFDFYRKMAGSQIYFFSY